MNKIKNYFKGRKFWWWTQRVIFTIILLLILVPSWREAIVSAFLRSRLPEQEFTTTTNIPVEDLTMRWPITELNGKEIKLGDLGDKPYFINIWATWCGPCVAEMKDLSSLYQRHKNDINFVFASPEKMGVLRAFDKKYNYGIPIYQSAKGFPPQFDLNAYPTTIIMANNKIVLFEKGAYKWDTDKADDFLNKLKK